MICISKSQNKAHEPTKARRDPWLKDKIGGRGLWGNPLSIRAIRAIRNSISHPAESSDRMAIVFCQRENQLASCQQVTMHSHIQNGLVAPLRNIALQPMLGARRWKISRHLKVIGESLAHGVLFLPVPHSILTTQMHQRVGGLSEGVTDEYGVAACIRLALLIGWLMQDVQPLVPLVRPMFSDYGTEGRFLTYRGLKAAVSASCSRPSTYAG